MLDQNTRNLQEYHDLYLVTDVTKYVGMSIVDIVHASRFPPAFEWLLACELFGCQLCGLGWHLGSKLGVLGCILAPSWRSWTAFWLQDGALGEHLGRS